MQAAEATPGDASLDVIADLLASVDAEQRREVIEALPVEERVAVARLMVSRLAGKGGSTT